VCGDSYDLCGDRYLLWDKLNKMNLVEKEYYANEQRIRSSGAKVVDKSTWQYRLNTCKQCKYHQTFTDNQNLFRCNQCGCAGFNFLLESAKCPLLKPKWK